MILAQSEKAATMLKAYRAAYNSATDQGYPASMLKIVRSEIKSKYAPEKLKQQIEIAKFVLDL